LHLIALDVTLNALSYAFAAQELDVSGCRNLTDKAFERLSVRAHLWLPRLHTLNVSRCERVRLESIEMMLSRRPPRGCVVIAPDGLKRAPEHSYRGLLNVVPIPETKADGPELEDIGLTASPLRQSIVPSTPTRGLTVATNSQWFMLSPSKRTPAALSYDGTKTPARIKAASVVRTPKLAKITEMKPRSEMAEVKSAVLPRWGLPAEGIRGDRTSHWHASTPRDWFSWAAVSEPEPDSDGMSAMLAPVVTELSDEEVMKARIGVPLLPALYSCVDVDPTHFVGVTWDAEEVAHLKQQR
jgi:hypothetical protein